MTRPPWEVADVIRIAGSRFRERYGASLTWPQVKVLRAIARCRTAALGGHLDVCTGCGYVAGISYNSCRNRHCPKCQTGAREKWLAKRQQELLPVNYFHLVFSVPHLLAPLMWQNKKALFTLLFDAAAASLLKVAATPAHFFLPVRVLSRVFRGKFVAGLRRTFRADQLTFYGECLPLANERNFAVFLRTLFREEWVVYSKPPFGGSEPVLHYLARYTHRVAISNHRILAVNHSQVTFRWKDYAHHNKQRTMTLTCEEFLRRFLQHLLPKGFPRIRYFGWLANRRRSKLLPLGRSLLPNMPEQTPATVVRQTAVWRCPRCHRPMSVLEHLTAAQLLETEGRQECTIDTS